MRSVENPQMQFGKTAIGDRVIDAKSRDDKPEALKGLQLIYTELGLRQRLFALLLEQVRSGVNLKVGRLDMNLWRILELAVLKQGLGCCDYRLQELADRVLKVAWVMLQNQMKIDPNQPKYDRDA